MEQLTGKKTGGLLTVILAAFFIVSLIGSSLLYTNSMNVKELALGQIQAYRIVLYAIAFCLISVGGRKERILACISAAVYISDALLFEMCRSGNMARVLINGVIYAVLFFAACLITEKIGFGKLSDRLPTVIIAVYFTVSAMLEYGFSLGKLLLALLQGVFFYGLVWALRRVHFSRKLPVSGKARVWFAVTGLLLCLGLIVYTIETFGMLAYGDGYDVKLSASGEFGEGTVCCYLVFTALGYILLLCKKETGGVMALLFSATLFMLMLFVFIAPITNGARALYPFFSRFVIGLAALLYSLAMLFMKRKPADNVELS